MDDHNPSVGNDSSNFTGDYFPYSETFLGDIVPWSLGVYLFFTILAVIANVLLLFAMYKDPLKCFRNPTSYFIANLGIADLLNSFFHMEELLVSQTAYRSTFDLPGAWATIHGIFGSFAFSLAFPSVTILALERYLSIVHPLWHRVKITSRVCYTSIAIIWLLNGIVPGLSMLRDPDVFVFTLTIYPGVLYVTTILICYLAYLSIRKQYSSLTADISRSESARRTMEIRLYNHNCFLTTIFIVNIVLTFGIIPIIGSHFKYNLEEGMHSTTSAAILFYVADILFLINISFNPFLYIWRLPKYRKTFFATYCCKK